MKSIGIDVDNIDDELKELIEEDLKRKNK